MHEDLGNVETVVWAACLGARRRDCEEHVDMQSWNGIHR